MPDNPSQPTYPVGTISRLLLMTDRRVQQLVKDGVIPKTEKNRYELAPCVQGYIRYLQERAVGNAAAPADFHVEKARLVKLQADKTQMEVDELGGKLVRVDEVKKELYSAITDCKNRLLSIPSKAAPIVTNETNPAIVQGVLDDLVREALTELSKEADEPDESTVDNQSGDDGVDPAPKVKSKRLGRPK